MYASYKMRGPPINGTAASAVSEGPAALYWLLLITLAISADLIAGKYLTGRIPNIGAILGTGAQRITDKLNRQGRSKGALKIRGILTLLLFIPPLYFLGAAANDLSRTSAATTAIALLAIIPILAQRKLWADHVSLGQKIATGKVAVDPEAVAQKSTQDIVLQYSSRFLPSAILLTVGGFAALLPYQFIVGVVETCVIQNQPTGPYFKYVRILHELVALPLSLVSGFLLGLAHFFVPGTNLHVFWHLSPNKTHTLASQFIPLNIMANGAGLNFLRKEGPKSTLSKESKWIGPQSGRAKLTPTDMRSIWLVVMVAFGLSLIALLMLFVFLSVNSINDL